MRSICRKLLRWYGLDDWSIAISDGGWLCQHSTKTIYLRNYDNFAMFLHELAHAIVGVRRDKDKTGHDSIWGDKFTALVDNYMSRDLVVK